MIMINDLMTGVLGTLEKHMNTRSVIGEPITMGDVTLVPVIDLMFGYGGGGGEGQDEKERGGNGGGAGAGARLAAKAVIVIKGGDVSVLPLGKGGGIDKIVEAIPNLIEKLGAMKESKQSPAADTAAE